MRAGSLSKVARYRLDLVGVQEVWWDKGGTERAGVCNLFYGKGNVEYRLETSFLFWYTTEWYQQLRK